MPVYDYACNKCMIVFEGIKSTSDMDCDECPKCGTTCKRVLHTSQNLRSPTWTPPPLARENKHGTLVSHVPKKWF